MPSATATTAAMPSEHHHRDFVDAFPTEAPGAGGSTFSVAPSSRDLRRSSEPGPSSRPSLSTRLPSGSTHGPFGFGRRSPRASTGVLARVPRLSVSSRSSVGGALNDITNVMPGRTSQAAPPKPQQQHKKPPAPQQEEKRAATCNAQHETRKEHVANSSTRDQDKHQNCAASSCSTIATTSTSAAAGDGSSAGTTSTGLCSTSGSVAAAAAATMAARRCSKGQLDVDQGANRECKASGSPFREDTENVQTVAEYMPDIIALLFSTESTCLPKGLVAEVQADVNGKMRGILVDWLIEVHMKYRLRPETLFVTINLIDRYLAKAQVPRRRLQLVGVVAMFIASKFEEVRPPQIGDFCYITDNAYTKKDIINMECAMLAALEFKVVIPTIHQFLECLERANRCDGAHREAARYIVELALLEHRMVRHPPSMIAASATLLSNELFGRSPCWPSALVRHSQYKETSLQNCVSELRALLSAAPSNSLQAVRKKYSHQNYHSVARMPNVTAALVAPAVSK